MRSQKNVYESSEEMLSSEKKIRKKPKARRVAAFMAKVDNVMVVFIA